MTTREVDAKIICEKYGHRYATVFEAISKKNVNYCGRCGHITPIPAKKEGE